MSRRLMPLLVLLPILVAGGGVAAGWYMKPAPKITPAAYQQVATATAGMVYDLMVANEFLAEPSQPQLNAVTVYPDGGATVNYTLHIMGIPHAAQFKSSVDARGDWSGLVPYNGGGAGDGPR